jgi:hypothetical protein
MKHRFFALFLAFSLVGFGSTSNAFAAATPAVQFGKRTVTVSGVSPGTDVVVFGVIKIPLLSYSRLQRFQAVVSAAKDGSASAQTDFDIPVTSVWVVADLRTGQVTLATPRPRGVATVPIGHSVIRGNADHFSFDRSFLDLIYVHAGEGAWIWHAVDGGAGDEDGPNGMTTIDIAKAIHIAGQSSPKVFSPGGTLVAIDFEDLVVMTTDVQALLPSAQL